MRNDISNDVYLKLELWEVLDADTLTRQTGERAQPQPVLSCNSMLAPSWMRSIGVLKTKTNKKMESDNKILAFCFFGV